METVTFDETKWQLVPRIPTVSMTNRGAPYLTGLTAYAYPTANKIFGAMLAAAPQYPEVETRKKLKVQVKELKTLLAALLPTPRRKSCRSYRTVVSVWLMI